MVVSCSIPAITHSVSSLSGTLHKKTNNPRIIINSLLKHPSHHKPHRIFTLYNPKRLKISVKAERETEESTVTVASVERENENGEIHLGTKPSEENGGESEGNEDQQELDWKTDEDFKKFMGNPSIEAAIKLEKKRTDRKLKELDRERSSDNPLVGLFNQVLRDNLSREKQRLEKAEESFKALDLNKVKPFSPKRNNHDSIFKTHVKSDHILYIF